MSNTGFRLRTLLSPERLLTVVFTLVAATAIGAITANSPLDAVALLLGTIAVALALTRPTLLFAAALLMLAVEPAKIFGPNSAAGHAETYKLLLYACALPLVLSRGLDRRRCAPLLAYVAVALITELLGSRLPGLTATKTLASLATLSLGWLVFAIDWRWASDHVLLKVLAWMPIASVLLGVGLQLSGAVPLFLNTSPPRLEGATIAAWLGTFGVCAALGCLVLHRRSQWKWAKWVGLADVLILGATLTRGAVVALTISAMPSLVRLGRRQLATRSVGGAVKLGFAVSLAVAAAAILVPQLIARDENATDHLAGQAGAHEVTSGRLRAWAVAYEQAKVNIVFGRGVGAGPIVGRSPGTPAGFTAQHNEYVRMLLEGGLFGTTLLLLAMVLTLTATIRRAPPSIRADLAAAGVAFAIYSITENTLSSAPIAIAFLFLFGIASSRGCLPSSTPVSLKASYGPNRDTGRFVTPGLITTSAAPRLTT